MAESLIKDAVETIDQLKAKKDEISGGISKIDREVNCLYHIIELVDCSASEMSLVSKKLRTLLQQRRSLKEELILVSNFLQGPIEKLKTAESTKAQSEEREKKYREEAYKTFEVLFGISKKIK